MKEAHIICLVRDYKVGDLRITLKKGELVKRPEAVARGSQDLQHAVRVGAVSIRYVQKAQEIRQPLDVHERRSPKRDFVRPPEMVVPSKLKAAPVADPPVVDPDSPVEAPPKEGGKRKRKTSSETVVSSDAVDMGAE